MNGQMFGRFAALALGAFLASAALAAEQVYKWTDKDGGVHYTRQAPLDVKAELITVHAGFSAPIEEAKPATSAATQHEQPDFCVNAKKNIDMLSGDKPVSSPDANGKPHLLNAEERKAQIDEAQKARDFYCKDNTAAAKK